MSDFSKRFLRLFRHEIDDLSCIIFQVVSGDMFTYILRTTEPTCTIWYNSISFGKRSLAALNNCMLASLFFTLDLQYKCNTQ